MNKKSELQKTMFGSTLWNIWIWLTIVLVVLADVNVVVSLGIEGVVGWHLFIPIVFLALDVILALVAAFSNFRFRYSLVFPIIYAAFTVVMGVVGIVVYCAVLDYIVFTSFALISWMIFELLSVATILLATIRASGKGLVFSIITVVLVVIFAAYSVFYVVIVAQDGFFGQGKSGSYSSEERTTTYRYDEETDTYIATGTLSGRGGTVLISDSVNGKKVGEVDCSIFLGDGITSARLLCDGDVKFSNTECIADLPDDFTVTASSDSIDGFKTYFYELSVETADGDIATYDARTDALRDAYADFANRITPEVEDGEVYIVFTYGYSDLQTLGVGNVLPTWISESGDKFEMSEFLKNIEVEDSFMYENMDPSKEENLYYYYTNYDKIILNELRDPDGDAIEGRGITAPMSVGVSYEDIYAVSISTNDTVYEGTEEFSEISDFSSSGFRYVTGSSANDLITNINNTANARAGFTYKWTYGDGKTLGSLENVIEDGMEISLEWTLDAPKIELVSSASGTYGDIITLTPTVSHADTSTISYSYSWTSTVGNAGSAINYTFSKALPSESGTYTFTVIASPSDTSLTSSASASVSVSISKKTLSFAWALDGVAIGILTDEQRTYSGVYKTLSSTASGVLDDDTTFSYTQSIESVKDAQTYSFYVTLDDDWGEYYAMDGTYSSSLEILRYEIEVSWDNETDLENLVYDGNVHAVQYTVTGLEQDVLGEESAITKDGADASEAKDTGSYVVTVTIDNSNYTLKGEVLTFSITPAPLTITEWSYVSTVYDGTAQHPEISTFSGKIGSDEITFSYTSGNTNVGNYSVTATSENPNYEITSGGVGTYAITPASLEVTTWTYEETVYNGAAQHPEVAEFNGGIGDDVITFSYTAGYTDANTGYTVTATSNNSNYEITSGDTQTYSITAYELTVVWGDETITYNGEDQIISHQFADAYGNIITSLGKDTISDALLNVTFSGAQTNAGTSYTASIVTTDMNSNYTIKSGTETTTYSIVAAPLTVSWDGTSFTYSGTNHYSEVTYSATGVQGETVGLTLTVTSSGNSSVTDNITNAGSYTATVSITDATAANNYNISNPTQEISVAKATLTVSWGGATAQFTYTGEAQQPVATITGICSSDTEETVIAYIVTEGNTTGGQSINAGSYTVTISLVDTDNYELSGNNYSLGYTISTADLTVSWDGTSFTYDGTNHYNEVTYGATGVKSETIGLTLTVTNSSGDVVETITNAGEYTATVSITESDVANNYTITNPTQAITVARATLTGTWSGISFTYDGTNHYSSVSYSATGAQNEAIAVTITITDWNEKEATELINAGSYTATVSISDETVAGNYDITNPTQVITVAKATLTVSWDGATSFTYTGEAQQPEATITGIYSPDIEDSVITYIVTGTNATNGESINAGEYTMTISLINTYNYELSGDNYSQNYSISATSLTVSWDDTSFTYDGTNHYSDVTCSATGVKGETINFTITVKNSSDDVVTDITNAGEYKATISITDATEANNYTISSPEQTITVAKATLTVSWDGATTSFTYSGEAQQPKATITEIYSPDTEETVIVYTVEGTNATNGKSINAGEYTVTISLIDTDNYELTEGNLFQTYTISKASLTVSWDDATIEFTYNGEAQQPKAEITGICDTDNESNVIAYTVTGDSATEGKSINAGSYTVTISLVDTANYELSGDNLSQEYTIFAASLTVSWNGTSFTYDGTNHYGDVICSATGVKGETIGLTVTITSDGTEVADITKAGSYIATVSITDATASNNYTITDSTQIVTVSKASVSVTWSDDGTPSFTWNNGEEINAETAGITCTYYVYSADEPSWTETEDITQAGTYYAVLSIAEVGNYEFASGADTTHEFTITID